MCYKYKDTKIAAHQCYVFYKQMKISFLLPRDRRDTDRREDDGRVTHVLLIFNYFFYFTE